MAIDAPEDGSMPSEETFLADGRLIGTCVVEFRGNLPVTLQSMEFVAWNLNFNPCVIERFTGPARHKRSEAADSKALPNAEQWLPNAPDYLYQSYPSNFEQKTPIGRAIFEIGVGTFCPDNVPTFSEHFPLQMYDRVVVTPRRDRIPKYD